MMKPVSTRLCHSVSPARIGTLMRFGFTERQARFLVHVLVFSGVFLMPLTPRDTEELDWYFRARRGEVVCPGRDPDLDLATAARKFGTARFEALYRMWQQRDVQALWAMQGPTLRDQLQRGWGRVEFAELPHQYLQLTPLVGAPGGVEKGLREGDNLASA